MDKNDLLVDIEKKIKNDFQSVANSFVSIGYYLKKVRDEKLYLDAGYETLWHYAEDRFRMSASKASRFMSINDKFSVDGNSPLLLVKYDGFSYSQLQEMLPMNDEQLSEVDPDMTVTEIRELKKPKEEENPNEQEGPEEEPNPPELNVTFEEDEKPQSESEDDNNISLEIDMSEDDEEDDIEEDAISQEVNTVEETKVSEPLKSVWQLGRFEDDDAAYGATRSGVVSETIKAMLEMYMTEINGQLHVYQFGKEYTVMTSADGQYIEFYNGDMFNFKTSILRFRKEYEWHKKYDNPVPTSQQPSGRCIHNPTYACTLSESAKLTTSHGTNCSTKRCNEDETVIKPPESVIKELESVWKPHYCESFGYDCNLGDRRELARDTGLDCTASCCCKCESVSECGCRCFVASDRCKKSEPEIVAEAEYQEVPDHNTTKKEILLKLISDDTNIVEQMRDYWAEHQPDTLLKYETMIESYKVLLAEMEHAVEEADPVEQPELPVLTNNERRKEWIEQYRSWPMWFETEQTGDRFYKYDFQDGKSFVVKDSLAHTWIGGKYSKDADYNLEGYYILGQKPTETYRPKVPTFRESACNMSQLIEHLKNMQRS